MKPLTETLAISEASRLNPSTSPDMRSKLSPDFVQSLFALKAQVLCAGHGVKGGLVSQFAALHGSSPATVYIWLKTECGYDAGRKPRADKGSSRLDANAVDFIAAAKRESLRGNGKAIMPTCVAMNIADTNGMNINVSKGRINTILRQQGLTHAALASPRDTVRMRSLHPNHVHQVDPSLCVLFYMGGKQMIMDEAAFNKNKPGNLAKIKLKLWRYVRYDHASGCLDVRYFEAAGENQSVLFDFLTYTWGKQDNRLTHGIPFLLLWDKGSANTSAAIRNWLDAMGVKHETHAPGHAWAKGGVEGGNNIVETHFESRLKLEPVNDVDELNQAAQNWARDYNANAIKHIDSRVTRDSGVKMVRDDLWHTITAEQLIALPPVDVCRWFFTGTAQTRVVKNLQISFKHPELDVPAIYKLHDWATQLTKNEKVQVLPLLGKGGMVRVEIEQLGAKAPLLVEVKPVVDFDSMGRDQAGQVFGEGYSRLPDSASVIAAKRMNQMVYGVTGLDEADTLRSKNSRPFASANEGKGITAHSHLGKEELVQRLPRVAQELDTEAIQAMRSAAKPELAKLTHTQAAITLRGLVGRNLTPAEYQWIASRFTDGVPADQVEALAEQLTRGDMQATGTHDAAPDASTFTGVFTGLRSVK